MKTGVSSEWCAASMKPCAATGRVVIHHEEAQPALCHAGSAAVVSVTCVGKTVALQTLPVQQNGGPLIGTNSPCCVVGDHAVVQHLQCAFE